MFLLNPHTRAVGKLEGNLQNGRGDNYCTRPVGKVILIVSGHDLTSPAIKPEIESSRKIPSRRSVTLVRQRADEL